MAGNATFGTIVRTLLLSSWAVGSVGCQKIEKSGRRIGLPQEAADSSKEESAEQGGLSSAAEESVRGALDFWHRKRKSPQLQCLPQQYMPNFGFNALIFGDMTQTQSDVEGRLAVGRNASFEDYLVGSKIIPDADRVDLVVGGNLTMTRGEVRSGKTYYGGVATTELAIFFGGLEQRPGYFPFDRVRSWSRLLTSTLARYPDNGDIQVTGSGPTYSFSLTGTNPRINVFNLSADEMATVDTLNIAVPSGSTALINITDSDVSMRAFGFNLTGTTANKVLFNLPEAIRLQMDAIGVLGSILAPSADVTFDNGAVDGFVVANSMQGTGEFHWVPFDGCLPWGAYYHHSTTKPAGRPVLSPE